MKRIAVFCIGLLFLFALGCSGDSGSGKLSADTPEGVAQAYYQALKDGKADVAYQYRKFSPPKTKEAFISERKSAGMTFKDFTVGKGKITGTTATVPVTFKTGNSGMPEFTMNIQLVKEKNWAISDLGIGGQTGMPSKGSSALPPASGANPHGAGGSVPLNK